jgi:chitinase
MAASEANRARFIGQAVEFCEANGYDGVDIDWEYVSNDREKADHVLFIEALGAALKARPRPLLLTMAAPASAYWARWIDLERLADDLDLIGLMTYDYHGAWSKHSGHNAPLYGAGGDACGSVDETFAYFLKRRVPAGKLLIGLPFFGASFDCGGWGEPFAKSGHLAYSEIMGLPAADWDLRWDGGARVPYMRRSDGKEIISFDDMRSVALKCQYAKDVQAGGVIIWELSQDLRPGGPELLEVVGKSLIFPHP